jgi:starch phosphorylase
LLRDIERLSRIVNHPARPVQFIFAGKAHPQDEPAKQLIREVVAASRRPDLRDRLVVLERYDVGLARSLVQGCDAWLNTPLRPLEASGTSGMKAVANGGLHISVRDGWWAEAYRPGAGWAIGSDAVEDPAVQDAADAESLYATLENEVAPAFYERDADAVPRKWVARMKESIASYAPVFSTHRMVGEYGRHAYEPAAANWRLLTTDGAAGARSAAAFLEAAGAAWPGVEIVSVEDSAADEVQGASLVSVVARVAHGALAPANLCAELLYGEVDAAGNLTDVHTVSMREQPGAGATVAFEASFEPPRGGRAGYTVRLTPRHDALPEECDTGLVRWW